MMTLRQIEAFKAIMEAETMVRAAEAMCLSQPAVSRLLADLEADLGYQLFERGKGKLSPRAEARELYTEVERSFSGLSRIDAVARRIGRRTGGRLRIVTLPVFTLAPLPRLTSRLLADRHRIWVSVQTRPPEGVIEGVAARQFDLGLATLPLEHPDVEVALLARVQFQCILHPDHPLAARKSVTVEDLIGVDFIAIRGEGTAQPCSEINSAFLEAGASFKVLMECSTMDFACRLVANGVGAIIGPPLFIDDLMRPHLRVVPFESEVAVEVAVIRPTRRAPGLLARRFIEAFAEALRLSGGRLHAPSQAAQSPRERDLSGAPPVPSEKTGSRPTSSGR